MVGKKIKLQDRLGRVVRVNSDGTNGATVGKNLRWPDGTVVNAADIRNPKADAGSTGGLAATVWKLIREIPANIQKLAKLVGTGFTTRGSDGEWYQRSIAQGEGIAVTNADGVDGDPVVALAELPDAGGGSLQKTERDSHGRLAGTSDATTDDLPEGSINRYFPEAPADGKQYARSSGDWSEVASSGSSLGPANAGPGIAIDASTPSAPIISSTVTGIALKGRVANHAALPLAGNASGDAYLNDADGRIYVWNGTAWPASGAGVIVGRIGNQVLLAGHDTSTGSASSSLYANKGSVWTTLEPVVIDSILFRVDEVSGGQYRAGLYRLASVTSSSAVIAEIAGLATAVTATSTATRARRFQFQSPARMLPGSTYAFVHSRIDATPTTSSGAQFLPAGSVALASVLPVVDGVQTCRNAVNLSLAVGNSVDLTAGTPFRVSILGYFG